MFKKILMIFGLVLINASYVIGSDNINSNISIDVHKSFAKGYREIANNIINEVKVQYPNNKLMNAIVNRNIEDVKEFLKGIKDIDERFEFWPKFSGFEGAQWNGELQEKMKIIQTYLSLALLNSVFDSNEEETNKSLAIIELLVKAKAGNAILVYAFLLKHEDGGIRDYVDQLKVFGWAILCGCSKRVLEKLLDCGFVSEDKCIYDNYKEFAEYIGSNDIVSFLDDYCKKRVPKHSGRSKKKKRNFSKKR